MFDVPAVGGDISVFEGVAAIALFGAGYAIHEALHVAVLRLFGADYTVRVLPTEEGQSKLTALFIGALVTVEMEDQPSRRVVAISSLAPLLQAIVPLSAWAYALTYPVVDLGTMIVLGVWAAVSLPSLNDWNTALRYRRDDATATEVMTHG